MTKHAAQFCDALKRNNVPHQFYFHQGGHANAPPDVLLNLWFTKYLYNQDNGVEDLPKSWVVRSEADACPARDRRPRPRPSDSATLTVADASPFRVGSTLTIPQTNADGAHECHARITTSVRTR